MNIINKQAIFVRKEGKIVIEDATAKIPAVRIDYDNGSYRYIVVNSFPTFSFGGELIEINCDEIMYNVPGFTNPVIVEDAADKVFPMGKMVIDSNRYVFAEGENAGQFTTPTIDDVNNEILDSVQVLDGNGVPTGAIEQVSFNPKKYAQLPRAGVKTNFDYWFGYLKNPVILPVQHQILAYAK